MRYTVFSLAHPYAPRQALWLALAASCALVGCTQPPTPVVAEVVRPALIAPVREGATPAMAFVGEVRAAQRAELAFAVNGRVLSVLVEPGDAVKRGQLLARLDTQPLQAQMTAAQGDVARAQAQATEVRQRIERIRQAQQAGAIGAGEWSTAQAELSTTEASLRSAQAQQATAQWSLEHAELRAPMDGVIGTRLIEPGQTAGPGAPVLTVDGAGRELMVSVPASLPLQPGQAINLHKDGASPQTTPSRVLRVGSRQEAGGLVRATLAVPSSAPVGSTWTVSIERMPGTHGLRTTELQVPLRAVVPGAQANQGHVLRLRPDGKTTEKVEVQIGAPQGDWIHITRGLVRGDQVVIAGASSITPGATIQPVAYPGGQP